MNKFSKQLVPDETVVPSLDLCIVLKPTVSIVKQNSLQDS